MTAALAQKESHSYISFRAGHARYALSVKHIRYITALHSIKPRIAPDAAGGEASVLFDYEEKVIPLYRFNAIIGEKSLADESSVLVELLSKRRQDHIDWIDALEKSLKTGCPFEKATDPHKCAFGQWYDTYKPADEELQSIMAQFDAPHKRIHKLAGTLLALVEDKTQMAKALAMLDDERFTTLKELMVLFDRAVLRLGDMLKPVVLVLEAQNNVFGIEVDGLDEMQEFTSDHWLAEQHQRGRKLCYEGFFQRGAASLYLNLHPYEFLQLALKSPQK